MDQSPAPDRGTLFRIVVNGVPFFAKGGNWVPISLTPNPVPIALLDRQVARFESELLLEEAKLALEQGDCVRAAERLRALQSRGGGRVVAITAWLAEHLPAAAVISRSGRA